MYSRDRNTNQPVISWKVLTRSLRVFGYSVDKLFRAVAMSAGKPFVICHLSEAFSSCTKISKECIPRNSITDRNFVYMYLSFDIY